MNRLWLVFSQAVTVAVALLFVVATFKPEWLPDARRLPWRSGAPQAQSLPLPAAQRSAAPTPPTESLSIAAQRAAPAVVSVTSTRLARAASRDPRANDPLFRFFFGDPRRDDGGEGGNGPAIGAGSGVIVSSDGYVLTNNHVVQGASGVTVHLADGREVAGKVVGTDPDTDLAVLKVELDRLPTITPGRMENLHVGDRVLAIGNPFDVGQTVTSGIVSAMGRSGLGLSTFENFIQTDAAINPGNSGGALVDINGDLIGINTAIFSRSGGSMGIGFAIPVDLASEVMQALIRDGQVTRGWIGVQPRELDPDFARSFQLGTDKGVLITGVLQGGPSAEAGMQPGDVVQEVAGQPVRSVSELLKQVAALAPGQTAPIVVQRGKETLTLNVKAGKRPPRQQQTEEQPR